MSNVIENPRGNDLIDGERRLVLHPAMTDQAAIAIWLAAFRTGSIHTVRSFRRESMRYLMYLEALKGESDRLLPSSTPDDVNQYLDFLVLPRPFTKAMLDRYGFALQPFRGTLRRSSIRQVIVILHAMYEALRNLPNDRGDAYITMNPFALVRSRVTGFAEDEYVEQALSKTEWDAVLKTIEQLPRITTRDKAHYARTRWIFQVLYRAFLRREEAAHLLMGDFEQSAEGWFIRLMGKGQKSAKIIVSTKLLSELSLYRQFLGLAPFPAPAEERPAIMTIAAPGNAKPISPQAIYVICTTIFNKASELIKDTDPAAAARLRAATPHWLRHTGISHALEQGVNPRYVQAQARHSSLKVTARYDHKDKLRWREQLETM